jgi:hypothetical protein
MLTSVRYRRASVADIVDSALVQLCIILSTKLSRAPATGRPIIERPSFEM